MSAIWGIIDFHGAPESTMVEKLVGAYQCYRIDRYEKVAGAGAEFGCCHQHLTKDAAAECLPIYDRAQNIIFTADCVLDNRDELSALLPDCEKDASDGSLLLAAYIKWGSSLGDYVAGAFAFAAFHTDTKTVVLCTDQMGCRSLFYSRQGERFIFSTAILPLAKLCQAVPCEQWISGCLFSVSDDMTLFRGLTPYQGVFQVPAACWMTVTRDESSQDTYWSPLKLRPDLRQPNEDAYRQLFVNTMSTSVRSMLRSSQKTGCTLSSGLTSASVSALAAAALAEEGKSLYSYTSVPLPDFPQDPSSGQIADESAGVRALCAQYSNILPRFQPCRGRDAFSELPALLPLIGYPMKSGLNLTWLSEIYRQASVEGCRLMLCGQYGYATVSYGTAQETISQLYASLHLFKARRAAKSFSARYNIPANKIKQASIPLQSEGDLSNCVSADVPLTSPELIQKYRLAQAAASKSKNYADTPSNSRRQRLNLVANPFALAQMGMFDTIMGLMYGVLIRDPSRDRRVVELCCRLPVECMLAGGMERGMVRTYMKGIVPDEILEDLQHRGVQSADYYYRSKLLWHNHRNRVVAALALPELRKYADSSLLQELSEKLKNNPAERLTETDLRQANVLYSCSLFLQSF